MSKRVKRVFTSSEVPHLWAHQTQAEARNGNHSLYFEGDTIYSYGAHFPIARHITNKGGRKAVLFNSGRYSVTTSGHQSAVRSTIPGGVQVFEVPSLRERFSCDADHNVNLVYYVQQSKDALSTAERARKTGSYELNRAFAYRDTAKVYAKFFGVTCPAFDFLPKGRKLAELKTKIAEREARAHIADAEKDARARARRAKQERIRSLDLAEQLELWRQGDPNVSTWQLNGASPALRIVGDIVETSQGARFPVEHACKGLKLVQACVSAQREYVRNGHTVHLGHYAIDKIEANGTVHAGCHVVTYDEIQRIATALQSRCMEVQQ